MSTGPGLVLQLQSDAMNSSVPLTDLLRKAKTVATKLKQNELAEWLEQEMTGYLKDAEIPAYRKQFAQLQWRNPVLGWSPLVGGDHMGEFRGPIGELQALMDAEGDKLTAGVPPAVIKFVSEQVGMDVDVRKLMSKHTLASIMDGVRNVIHDWALRLEAAGINGEGLTFSPMETARAQSVVVHIGSITNATGIGAFGDYATITATQSVDIKQAAQQVQELVQQVERALPNSGFPKGMEAEVVSQLAALKAAASTSKPDASKLRMLLGSLQRTMEGAAGNLIASGVVGMIHNIFPHL